MKRFFRFLICAALCLTVLCANIVVGNAASDEFFSKVDMLFIEIERANRGLSGELERIKKLRTYMELRKANYQAHIGEYNFLSRIKEYNHYLTCWENYYSYQYKRDCCIAELQNYLSGCSVLEFCTMEK